MPGNLQRKAGGVREREKITETSSIFEVLEKPNLGEIGQEKKRVAGRGQEYERNAHFWGRKP